MEFPGPMGRALALAVGLGAALLWSALAAAAAETIYVADEDSDTVSVIDAGRLERVAVVPVGKSPHDVQVSPDGRIAWVTGEWNRRREARLAQRTPSESGGEVWAIDTTTHRAVGRVAVGRHPAHIALTPDGRFAWVANRGDNTVSVIDTSARREVATVAVGTYPYGIRVRPGGREVYVANLSGGTVSIVDVERRAEVAQIPAGKEPADVAFTHDGRLALVALREEGRVAIIDADERKVVGRVEVGPVPIKVVTDLGSALVTNHGTRDTPRGRVTVVDLATLTVSGTVDVGLGAHGIALGDDGRFAYVTNAHASSLSVIDVTKRKVIANVPTGRGPNGVAVRR